MTKMSLVQRSHNPVLYIAMIASLILTTAVIEIPFLANAFGFTPINLVDYVISIGLALCVIPAVEIVKAIQRKVSK